MTNDPNNEIKFTVDKFIFRFPRNLLYGSDRLWIAQENDAIRIGMSDFIQQRNRDSAVKYSLVATPVKSQPVIEPQIEIVPKQ
jgi:hypothetical protein